MRGTNRRPRVRRLSATGLVAGALLVMGGLPVPAGASGPLPTGPGVSGEMQISPNDGNVYETVSAAIDPNDPATIVAGADSWVSPYDGSSSYLRPVQVFGTSNAGTSWSSPSSLPPTPTLPYNVSAAEGRFPSLAITASGVTYAGSIAMHGGFHPAPSPSLVTRSANHGTTWGSQALISQDPTAWGATLIADQSASAYRNRVYAWQSIACCPDSPNPYMYMYVARSDDGSNWASTQVSSTGGGVNPVVGSDGTVYVGVGGASANQVVITKSTDGGVTFGAPGSAVTFAMPQSAAMLPNFGTPNCSSYISPNMSLAVDRTQGVNDGNLYLVWADNPNPPHVHIYFARSTDRGATWSTPVQIDTGNANDAWEPALSVDDAYGTVVLSWYDRRDDLGNKFYRIYYTQSTDGGATFLPSQTAVSSAQADPTTNCTATGFSASIVASHGIAHPFWTDSRSGTNEIFTARVSELAILRSFGRAPAPAGSPTPWKPRLATTPPPTSAAISQRGRPVLGSAPGSWTTTRSPAVRVSGCGTGCSSMRLR